MSISRGRGGWSLRRIGKVDSICQVCRWGLLLLVGIFCIPVKAIAQSQELADQPGIGGGEAAQTAADGEWDRELQRFTLGQGVDVVGSEKTVIATSEDTLLDIATRHAIGYEEIRLANPEVDVWLPGEGTEVKIPSYFILPNVHREGVVINLAEMRLYYFPPGADVVETFPVSVGRMDWTTPLGETKITDLIEDPAWFPPSSIREQVAERGDEIPRQVPPGPNNPLGEYAVMLDISGYLLHGTNRPWGIGMRATHGCIRLHPFDIEHLFGQLERGTPVKIINQPFKAGWSADGELYLQAFPLFEENRDLSRQEKISMATSAVAAALGNLRHRVKGDLVRAVAVKQTGDLINISRSSNSWSVNLDNSPQGYGANQPPLDPEG